MELIGISTPQEHSIYVKQGSLPEQRWVIVATTDEVLVKLYYTSKDPGDKLKDLLIENDIPAVIAIAMVSKTGFFLKIPTADDPSELFKKLPGVDLVVKHPVDSTHAKLWTVVVSLNDSHKWTREAIAEWIENTCDVKDISFNVQEVTSAEVPISEFTRLVKIKRIL